MGPEWEAEDAAIRAHNKEWSRQFSIVMGFQRAGMDAEENGNLDEAVKNYSKAIRSGSELPLMGLNSYANSIERICIVLRKQKNYAAEIKYIELLKQQILERGNPDEKDRLRLYRCEQRLNKAKMLLDKYGEGADEVQVPDV